MEHPPEPDNSASMSQQRKDGNKAVFQANGLVDVGDANVFTGLSGLRRLEIVRNKPKIRRQRIGILGQQPPVQQPPYGWRKEDNFGKRRIAAWKMGRKSNTDLEVGSEKCWARAEI
ncbi:uncharacterized protein J4E79_003638 [Alternaria viburni]|uniref:uncharacterized protein n=1 Tax=Alternaria viburni TaxID=566460 RepID=UPI0020C3C1EE|nr:uncharacterized protein J4E79_003638 [Alternaria viburni]KAI4664137.1 hypothetical protein J4E79_003638 [Alternaria viburni]